jgi:two-component system, cell cycle sensor histidine kinase and response regulator CckA
MTQDSIHKTFAETTGNETILLVEDEEIIRLMLTEILRQQGYVVLEASRASEALALAANHVKSIDLLVTDMSMPGMNGWDMAHALRATRRGLPVLFISGHSDHETMQWGKMEPPVEHLYKPFSMEQFLHKARHMLDAHKLPGNAGESPKSTHQ